MTLGPSDPPAGKSKKIRIDVLLTERGLAPSRERAQALILSGNVLVDDVPVTKPGHSVSSLSTVRIRGEDHPYVSRGGVKLAAALDSFKIDVAGKIGLDVGASTGGFTQVLLLRGARKVHAVDVGHSQLDWKIRQDPRVVVYEKLNAKLLTFESIGERAGVIVIDVSFISLTKILAPLIAVSDDLTEWVTLIKPQFEVGREHVGKGGIVQSEEARAQAVQDVTEFAKTVGLNRIGLIDSPITGTDGNREFLAHWKRI